MPAFFQGLKKIEPVYEWVYKIFMLICKLMLVADILITTWIVIARYITAIPTPSWGEDVILTLMAYMAVLSAALAIRRNAHIRMTSFDIYLPKKFVEFLDLVADVAVCVLAIIMLTVGLKFAIGIGSVGYYSSMPSVSKFWQYFPIPLAGIAMLFFELERIAVDIEHLCGIYGHLGYVEEGKEEN